MIACCHRYNFFSSAAGENGSAGGYVKDRMQVLCLNAPRTLKASKFQDLPPFRSKGAIRTREAPLVFMFIFLNTRYNILNYQAP